MRVRIAPQEQASDLVSFLENNNYPHTWPEDWLRRSCLMCRVDRGPNDTAAWVWFHWIDGADMVLEMHVAAQMGARGRWLTRGVLSDLHKVAELVGAKGVLARAPTPALQRVLSRIGFDTAGPFSFKTIEQ